MRHDEKPGGFARPVLEPTGPLEGLISPKLAMSVRTTHVAGPADARQVWLEVVERVLDQGCELGVQVPAPRRGSLG